jgi:hypothetical protein
MSREQAALPRGDQNYDARAPGNQTALNTRADPLAAQSRHAPPHPRLVRGHVPHTLHDGRAAFQNNPDMHTRLEIAVGPRERRERRRGRDERRSL